MILNPHTIPYFICLVLALGCGLFVLFHNPKEKLNRIFFFICVDIAAWMSFLIPSNFTNSEHTLTLYFRITYCFICFLPIMYFTFISTYVNAKENIFWYRFNALIGLLLCLINITTPWLIEGINFLPWFPYPKAGPWHIFLIIHCVTLVCFSIKLAMQEIRNKKTSPKALNHLKYMLSGMIVLAFGMWDVGFPWKLRL